MPPLPTSVLSHPNEEQFVIPLNGQRGWSVVEALPTEVVNQAAALGPAHTQALREQVERQAAAAAAQKRDP